MFILLALCFLSLCALSVGDCWQGLWSELRFLGEHALCSSLCSLEHKHTSLSTCNQHFNVLFVVFNPILCSSLHAFSVATSCYSNIVQRECVDFCCWRHVKLVMQLSYAALSKWPFSFFWACMVKLDKELPFVQAISGSANTFAPSCGMLKCVFNLWHKVKFRRERCMLIPRSALSEIPHLWSRITVQRWLYMKRDPVSPTATPSFPSQPWKIEEHKGKACQGSRHF